jgi:hypothetical protein
LASVVHYGLPGRGKRRDERSTYFDESSRKCGGHCCERTVRQIIGVAWVRTGVCGETVRPRCRKTNCFLDQFGGPECSQLSGRVSAPNEERSFFVSGCGRGIANCICRNDRHNSGSSEKKRPKNESIGCRSQARRCRPRRHRSACVLVWDGPGCVARAAPDHERAPGKFQARRLRKKCCSFGCHKCNASRGGVKQRATCAAERTTGYGKSPGSQPAAKSPVTQLERFERRESRGSARLFGCYLSQRHSTKYRESKQSPCSTLVRTNNVRGARRTGRDACVRTRLRRDCLAGPAIR